VAFCPNLGRFLGGAALPSAEAGLGLADKSIQPDQGGANATAGHEVRLIPAHFVRIVGVESLFHSLKVAQVSTALLRGANGKRKLTIMPCYRQLTSTPSELV
jgi:hypothetical protein